MTIFKLEHDKAVQRKIDWTYYCSYGGSGDGDSWRISEQWITAMDLGFWCFLVLSIGAVASIVGAWVVSVRNTATPIVTGGFIFHIIMIVWIAIVRFSPGGQSCASREGLADIRATGEFLMYALIGMVALGWLHFILLWLGNRAPKGAEEGEEGEKEGEKDRS